MNKTEAMRERRGIKFHIRAINSSRKDAQLVYDGVKLAFVTNRLPILATCKHGLFVHDGLLTLL